MRRFKSLLIMIPLVTTVWSTANAAENAGPANEDIFQFEPRAGDPVEAYRGTVQVPENRNDPDSRMLTLHYVRFSATGETPGAPIVYLAGGPGGSGIATASGWRFPLFMAMREFGDVIAFDQRGTGASDDTPPCVSSQVIDPAAFMPDSDAFEMQRQAVKECLAFWVREGIDPHGYNTLESVGDLDALRRHLKAEKLSLWDISYGSHLALAALKEMDTHLERVIIASAEGLDQTVKLPARTDAYFDRLQDAINTSSDARGVFTDIKALMRRVHGKLEAEPITISMPGDRAGTSTDIAFQRRHMQMVASGMIADPKRFAVQLLYLYAALDQGDASPLVPFLQRWFRPGMPISFRVMPLMMDIASGIGAERRALIETQAQTALLGPFLNDTLYLIDAAPGFDLGDDFRALPKAATPTLVLSGTLDGRTYLESQREAVAGLENRQMVTIRNAGHNLFMVSPEVTEAIQTFMRGGDVDGKEIIVDQPKLGR